MDEARYVSFPGTDIEVKIVLPVPFRRSLLSACCRRTGIPLCKSLKGLQDDNQSTEREIGPNLYDVHHCRPKLLRLSCLRGLLQYGSQAAGRGTHNPRTPGTNAGAP